MIDLSVFTDSYAWNMFGFVAVCVVVERLWKMIYQPEKSDD